MTNIDDLNKTRRENTLALIEKAGGVPAFASKLNKDPSQVRRWFPPKKDPDAEIKQNIGNKMAREIEKSFDKPLGWLDESHASERAEEREFIISQIIEYVENNHPKMNSLSKARLINDMLTEHERCSISKPSALERAMRIWMSFFNRAK